MRTGGWGKHIQRFESRHSLMNIWWRDTEELALRIPSVSPFKEKPARSPIAHSEKGNPAQTKPEWEAMGMRADTERQKRRNTLPACSGADAEP